MRLCMQSQLSCCVDAAAAAHYLQVLIRSAGYCTTYWGPQLHLYQNITWDRCCRDNY